MSIGEGDMALIVRTVTDVVMHIIDRRFYEEDTDFPLHSCKVTDESIQILFQTIQYLTDTIVLRRDLLKTQQQECSECQVERLADLMNKVECN